MMIVAVVRSPRLRAASDPAIPSHTAAKNSGGLTRTYPKDQAATAANGAGPRTYAATRRPTAPEATAACTGRSPLRERRPSTANAARNSTSPATKNQPAPKHQAPGAERPAEKKAHARRRGEGDDADPARRRRKRNRGGKRREERE